ncbi:expressed protein [Phakopsora pachyrhizi]|uniref:Expressed protein n=1 Tax=Phakopsora pachyrhizi TaxID=170000 RepID=A0AAV0BJE7_PHAPC|nr:expressed protein [Phakopsora pachyrhizi]
MMFTALKVVPSMFLILQTLLALLATSLNIGMAKDIPPASVCYSYSNSDNDRATCHGATCPDGCSWPFITAQNCVPTGPTSSKSTTQTCHIGYWKDGTDGSEFFLSFLLNSRRAHHPLSLALPDTMTGFALERQVFMRLKINSFVHLFIYFQKKKKYALIG